MPRVAVAAALHSSATVCLAMTKRPLFLADRRPKIGVALLVLLVFAAGTATHSAGQPSEMTVKAAFVINFLKFVEWPPVARGTPLVLVLAGDAPIAAALHGHAVGLQIGGRPVKVRVATTPAQIGSADAVFIAAGERERMPAILRALDQRPVLTIGDSDGFAASGVMLNMVMQDQRVRVEANTLAASRAGLKVSAHLLRLARIVG